MKKTAALKILLAILILNILFPYGFFVWALSDSADINLRVNSFCGNGTCESAYDEDESSCPVDCGCNNNGACETNRSENNGNCPLDCPLVPTPTPTPAPTATAIPLPGGGAVLIPDITPPFIYNLFISRITMSSARISWETDELAACQLFLGETEEYKKETYSEVVFFQKHSLGIDNLSSGKLYHFKISCGDTSNNKSETADQRFATLTAPDVAPPANVSNLRASPGDKKITLTWENPSDKDFKGVKILRSDKFYPSDPWDGENVYDGSSVSLEDKGLQNNVRYYYTVFAYDQSGNYSSGAIVSEVPRIIFPPEKKPPFFPPLPPEVIPPEKPAPPEIEKINLNDFIFIQDNRGVPLTEEKFFEIKAGSPLTASLGYEKVPEVLKTIMVTLEKDDRFFSFLLRINKEKTVYEATLLTPEEPGVYPLTITIMDYKHQVLKQIKGELRVIGAGIISETNLQKCSFRNLIFWAVLALPLLILLLLVILYFRKKAREKENKINNIVQKMN